MRKFNKLTALLLSLLLLLSLFPVSALAEDPPPSEEEEPGTIELVPPEDAGPDALPPEPDGPQAVLASGKCGSALSWKLTDAGVLTISGNGAMPNYEYDGQPWRDYAGDINSIVVGSGVTRIGTYAFSSTCAVTVSIPSTVNTIGECAFESCSELSSVKIPASVTLVDDNAFYDCSKLSSVTLNEGLKTLGYGAFSYCTSLTTLTIPASVTEICSGLVDCSSSLYSIQVKSGNANYKSVDGVLFSKDGTILCAYPGGLNSSSYTVPSKVTELEFSAFSSNSYLKSLSLPSGLQIIGAWAFAGTSLSSLTLPAAVNDLGTFAFDGCLSLSAIQVNSANANFKSVDGVLFSKDGSILLAYPPAKSGSSYTVPSGVTQIEVDSFAFASKLKTVSLPSGLEEILDLAFSDCPGLRSIRFPSSLSFLGSQAFASDYDLSSITFTGSAPGLGELCFDDVTAAVYYPAGNSSWSSDLLDGCGGNLLLYADVSGRPSISTQPKSVTAASGSTAKFTVAASGSSLKYQWQYRPKGGGVWNDCGSTVGFDTATLSVTAASGRNGYQYRCRVSNTKGAVFSDAAVLTIAVGKPTISAHPKSVTVAEGGTAKFSVTASGAGSYQWQWSPDSGNTWKDCSSATTGYNKATLQVSATAARSGYQYRCKVSNSAGTSTSGTATLTVLSKPTVTAQPKSTTAYKGMTAKFTVTAKGGSLSYQWQWRASSSGSWTNCTSATTGYNKATLQVTATEARNGYQYRCKISNSAGSTTSSTATLTVSVKPVIVTQPKSVTAAVGTTAKFYVGAQGVGSYRWQWRAGSTGTWTDCSSATVGFNKATLEVSATAARNGYQYRCKITNSKGTTTSSTVTLTVVAKPSITSQPKSVTATAGSTAKFTVAASGTGLSFQWQWRSGSSGTWANSTATGCKTATLSISAAAARNGYQYRCKITNLAGTVTSSTVTLTVK